MPNLGRMQRPLPVALSLLLAWAAIAAPSSQPWDKSSTEWTPAELAQVLSNSPWSQQSSAVMADPADSIEPANNSATPIAGMAGANNNARTGGDHWDGEIGRNRKGHLATVPVSVRWESALPVREALRKSSTATASGPAPGDPNDYILSVTGLIPGGRYRAAGTPETASHSDDTADSRNPEEVLEAFMQNSALVSKGFARIRPENVKLDPATGAIQIFFPRSHPIELHRKEVVFVTHFGGLTVQTRFRLAAMKYQGKLEL